MRLNHPVDVPESILKNWQHIVDILAKIIGIPAALIMRLVKEDIEVYVSSETPGNPYHSGDREYFENSGLYCERVIKTRDKLLVPDALKDVEWKNNPDVKLNMISYLGFPILLPDDQPFGTLCVLDRKENPYSETFIDLMKRFRDLVQSDLEILYMNRILGDENKKLSDYLGELKALRSTEEKYRLVVENANDGIVIIRDDRIDFHNARFADMMGYDIDELDNFIFSRIYSGEGIPGMDKGRTGKKDGKTDAFQSEAVLKKKDGDLIDVEVTLNTIHYPDGDAVFAIIRDITERKKAEEELKNANELLSLFIRNSPIYTFIKDVTPEESRVLMVSSNYEEMIGIPESRMVGKTMSELFPKDFAEKMTADDWKVVSEGKVLKLEEEFKGRSYSTIKFPITLKGRNLLAGYTIDLTERKRMEDELRKLKDDLELQVAEKTIELKERISELERFYDATVDRELRMKELWDEIEILRSKKKD